VTNFTAWGFPPRAAELQAKPKDTRSADHPARPRNPMAATAWHGCKRRPARENRYGNIDLMAGRRLGSSRTFHAKVKDHASKVAAPAHPAEHTSPTFKDRSIEKSHRRKSAGELALAIQPSAYTPTGSDAAGYHEIKVSVLRHDAKKKKLKGFAPPPRYYLATPVKANLAISLRQCASKSVASRGRAAGASLRAFQRKKCGGMDMLGVRLRGSPKLSLQQQRAGCIDLPGEDCR